MARRPSVAREEGVETLPHSVAPVRLIRPYGFIETVHDKGRFDWVAGEIVANPKTIALLKERGAPIEEIHDPD